MMKFFRKYNKQLLAVFMVALMVVFIGGSALQTLMTPKSNPVVARSNYGPVTLGDQQAANERTQLLEFMGFDWRHPVGGSSKPIESVDWILLRREAEKLETSAGLDQVRATLTDPTIDSRINDVSRKLRVKPELIHWALADLRSIQQAASAIGGASVPSEAELMTAARDALETVSFRTVVLPAQAFVDKDYQPTADEIKRHFEKYRDKERGTGLHFGYYRKPSLKVQYLTIDRKAIAANIGVANLERKAKSYYEEKRAVDSAFKRPNNPGPDPAAIGKIEGPPAPPFDPYLTFEESKDKAIEGLRKQYANEAAGRLADWIVQYTSESFLEVERDADGYKPAPANVAKPEFYGELVARIPQTMSFPQAVVISTTDFFTAEEAPEVPELGSASCLPERGIPQSFQTLAFRNRAMVPKVPTGEGVIAADYLSLHQTCQCPLTDRASGNLYVFRVIEAKPGHPPESVDEVRDDVIADLRLVQGYETARKRAESLRQCMSYETLKEAYEADPDLTAFKASGEGASSGYFEPPPMSRVLKHQASRGRPAEGAFAGIGIGNLPNDVVDAFFALEQADEKTKVVELADRPAAMVVEWVETKPAPEDEFNSFRKQLVQQLADARWRSAVSDWLDPEQIRARTGFALGTK